MSRQLASRMAVRRPPVGGAALAARARVHLKRAIDIAASALGLLLLSPLFLVIALAIRMESRGPALFRQARVGTNGRTFELVKLRTMVDGADEVKDRLRTHNESDGCLFKIRDDPRMTRIGRFLRRFSLDEAPQLWNVLRGDMSLVGPRPLPASDYDFGEPGMRERLAVPPGLTGLWQISGRSELGEEDLIRLDLAYIREHTLLIDLWIILRTIPAVLGGRGAY